MEELRLKAPAKINLHLQVLNKRQDGFHNISSLFTLIDLCDTLSFKKNKKDIELIESEPFENNIVLKAANLIKEYCSVEEGVRIELNKNIPDQKGL
jgi:4-diphosphocytidyl-2-C-methyl-D-erythritol kinase